MGALLMDVDCGTIKKFRLQDAVMNGWDLFPIGVRSDGGLDVIIE